MAFGLHCTNCALQEGSHFDPYFEDEACDEYQSPSPGAEADLKKKGNGKDWPNEDLGNGIFDEP